MAAQKQPDSPSQNSKYSINVDNCTIDKLVMGDYNTVNDNRSGRSRPPSQESSPILDSGESPFTKGKRVCLDNSSRDNGEDTVSGKRDHRSQQPKNGSYPIWSTRLWNLDNFSRDNGEDTVSGKRDHRSQQPKNGSYPIWSKLQVLQNMFLVICTRVRQWQYSVLMASLSNIELYFFILV